jgi:hypothetical protein
MTTHDCDHPRDEYDVVCQTCGAAFTDRADTVQGATENAFRHLLGAGALVCGDCGYPDLVSEYQDYGQSKLCCARCGASGLVWRPARTSSATESP